jgi:hypothetical protein
LQSEFNKQLVSIEYSAVPVNLGNFQVFACEKDGDFLCLKPKFFKLNGKSKMNRFRSSKKEMVVICDEIELQFGIDKRRFFNFLKELDIEILDTTEEFFKPFTLMFFKKIFISEKNTLIDMNEALNFFLTLKLASVRKRDTLWGLINKNDKNLKPITNKVFKKFLDDEYLRIKKIRVDSGYTSSQRRDYESKLKFYNDFFAKNPDILELQIKQFPCALKIEEVLKNHPILKSHFSDYNPDLNLVNNYIDYINHVITDLG